ncbi:MAG: heme biosynthesis HemY N-terminal domain-containing protein [Halioglobus sp.]
MRRLFFLMLIALLAGVGVVAVIETDPGYVLVSYGNYTLETSLWVGLLLFLVFTLLVYAVVRLVRRLLAGQSSLVNWFGGRQSQRSARLTTRGLINYIEGNWSKARQQLLKGVKGSETPLMNYLAAARASDSMNEPDKVREYLGAAEAADSNAIVAVEITEAQIRLAAQDYEQAVSVLTRARRNAGKHPQVLTLLHEAYSGLGDWLNLLELLPELRKHRILSSDALDKLEHDAQTQLLIESPADKDKTGLDYVQGRWQALSANLKKDPDLLQTYLARLIELEAFDEAEKLTIRSLKHEWSDQLALLFGLIQGANPARQLAQAEGWLAQHDSSAQLKLTLGRLAARNKLWGKARDYFESAYKQQRSSEVCAELGRLLTALGEPGVAAAYYREGLLLREADLPDLPMPDKLLPPGRQSGS